MRVCVCTGAPCGTHRAPHRSDPYGLKILSVYMSGSKNMSYDSANLTTADIFWLGVRPSDLDKYHVPEVRAALRLPRCDLIAYALLAPGVPPGDDGC